MKDDFNPDSRAARDAFLNTVPTPDNRIQVIHELILYQDKLSWTILGIFFTLNLAFLGGALVLFASIEMINAFLIIVGEFIFIAIVSEKLLFRAFKRTHEYRMMYIHWARDLPDEFIYRPGWNAHENNTDSIEKFIEGKMKSLKFAFYLPWFAALIVFLISTIIFYI